MKKIFNSLIYFSIACAMIQPAYSEEKKAMRGPADIAGDALEKKSWKETPPRGWQLFFGFSHSNYDIDYSNITDHTPVRPDPSNTAQTLKAADGNPPIENTARPFGPVIGIGKDFSFSPEWGIGVNIKGGYETTGVHAVSATWEITNDNAKFKVVSGDLFLDVNYNFFYKFLHWRPYVGVGYELGSMELGPVDFTNATPGSGAAFADYASPKYRWTKKDSYNAIKFGAGIKFFNREGLFSNIRVAYEIRSVSSTELTGTRDAASNGEVAGSGDTITLGSGSGTFEHDSAEIALMFGFTF